MERAAVAGTVTEKHHGDGIGFLESGCQGGPHCQTEAAAHNAVGPQHSNAEIGNVLGPPFALAVAGGLAVQLCHHGVQLRALGDAVAVAAMGTFDVVLAVQTGAYAGGDGLLTNVDMNVS